MHTAHSLLNGALYQIKQLSVYMIIVLEGSAFFFSLTHLPLEHRHVTILQTLKNSYCYVGFAVYYHLLVFVCCNPDGMCVVSFRLSVYDAIILLFGLEWIFSHSAETQLSQGVFAIYRQNHSRLPC